MDQKRKSALTTGLILILVGVVFLLGQLMPGWWNWMGPFSWPLIVVGVGLLLLIIGLISNQPELTVPACVVGGIGGLLYWQNSTGNWESWAYVWTLIPGFAGLGVLLMGLVRGQMRQIWEGLGGILVSLVLFGIFASLFGGPVSLGQYWPVLLIVLGLISLAQVFLRRK